VKFKILIPKDLTPKQKEILEKFKKHEDLHKDKYYEELKKEFLYNEKIK
jgi:DnaJ-class molecular chaperone